MKICYKRYNWNRMLGHEGVRYVKRVTLKLKQKKTLFLGKCWFVICLLNNELGCMQNNITEHS